MKNYYVFFITNNMKVQNSNNQIEGIINITVGDQPNVILYNDNTNTLNNENNNDSETTALERLEKDFLNNENTTQDDKKTKSKQSKKDKHSFECCICLNKKTKKENYIMTPCKHEFCCSCLLKHITTAKTCPLCRHNIVDNCINTFQPIRIRQAVNIMKMTIDSYDFDAEYNAMAAFNDKNILSSLVKTISVDCVRSVLQAQKDMNFVNENIEQFINNMSDNTEDEM